MTYENLKLENQVCFPVYAASRLITREYQPELDKLGITYPQYLVLMILWEQDGVTVKDITKKLFLNTNTITPLLKRMEKQGLVLRERASADERKVIVSLTKLGEELKEEATLIPERLAKQLLNETFNVDDLIKLKDDLNLVINYLSNKRK